MSKKKQGSEGFTLFELLVVISIISMIVAVATVAYSGVQKRSRDARRKGDMQAIQKGFEQYYNDNDGYSATCADMTTYLPGGLPQDPKNSGTYVYGKTCKTYGYYYCAKLENGQGNAAAAGSCNDTTQICSFTAGTAYFCVTNLQ